MSVLAQSATHPVLDKIETQHRKMRRMGRSADACLDWLIGKYREVLSNEPELNLNTVKSRVSRAREEAVVPPVAKATGQDWSRAYARLDWLLSRFYKPRNTSRQNRGAWKPQAKR